MDVVVAVPEGGEVEGGGAGAYGKVSDTELLVIRKFRRSV